MRESYKGKYISVVFSIITTLGHPQYETHVACKISHYRTTAPRAAAVITCNQKKSDFFILINLRHAAIE